MVDQAPKTPSPADISQIAGVRHHRRRCSPAALASLRKAGLKFDIMTTSFFLGRWSIKPAPNSGMPSWQDR